MATAARPITKEDNIRPPLVTLDQLKVDFLHIANAVTELEVACTAIPPVLEDEVDLALVTATASKLLKYAKRVEEVRDEYGRPYLEAQRVINAHFKHDLGKRLDDALTNLEARSKPYLKKKADKEKVIREAAEKAAREKADAAAKAAREAISTGNAEKATAAVTQSNTLADVAAKATQQAAAPISQLAKTVTSEGSASLRENWTFADLDVDTVDLTALRPFITQAAIEQALRQFIKSGRREIVGARIFDDAKTRFSA